MIAHFYRFYTKYRVANTLGNIAILAIATGFAVVSEAIWRRPEEEVFLRSALLVVFLALLMPVVHYFIVVKGALYYLVGKQSNPPRITTINRLLDTRLMSEPWEVESKDANFDVTNVVRR